MVVRQLSFVVLLLALVGSVLAADYYDVLGVQRSANAKEIKAAYRKLSKQYHPDKAGGDEEKYMTINEAFQVLSDDDKRRVYDQYGEEGLANDGRGQQQNGFGSFFGSMFGGGGGGGRGQLRQGHAMSVPLQVTLDELYNGKRMHVMHRKQMLCSHCRGSGAERPDDVTKCTQCNGQGVVLKTQRLAPGFVQQVQTTCDKCGGKGKIQTSTCHHCHGTKIETGDKELVLNIERGMPNGERLVFQQECDELPDERPGDLTFVLETVPHKLFRREGNDLHMEMQITLLEALVGFERSIEHLDGHTVEVKESGVTRPNQVRSVQNEGMPVFEFPHEFGSLFIKYKIKMPRELSDAKKDAVRALFQDVEF